MLQVIAVAVGGAAGAVLRYWLSSWVTRWSAPLFFPFGTLLVNVIGSFALGLLAGYLAGERPGVSVELRLLLATGFLGAFTTFSTFSVETLAAFRQGLPGIAVANIGASLLLALGTCWLGLELGGRL